MKKHWLAFLILGLSALACGLFSPASLPEPTQAPVTSVVSTLPPTIPLPTPTEIETATPESVQSISEIHMFDANNGWAWSSGVEGSNVLLHTSDGGQTWINLTPRDHPLFQGGSYFLDSETAWVPTTMALMHTTDGGQTWSVFPQTFTVDNAFYSFSSSEDGLAETFDVGAGNAYIRFFETHDGGITWTPVLITPRSAESNLPAGTVHLCNICGDQLHYFPPNKVIITYGGMMNYENQILHLDISTNLGKSWHEINLPVPAKYSNGWVNPYLTNFLSANDGFLAVDMSKQDTNGNGLYHAIVLYDTADGGASWKMMPGIIENPNIYTPSIDFISPADAFIICGADLCITHDGGQSWQMVQPNIDFGNNNPDRSVAQIDFVDDITGWIVVNDHDNFLLYKTIDGGATWTVVK